MDRGTGDDMEINGSVARPVKLDYKAAAGSVSTANLGLALRSNRLSFA
jgi:hypothetical protein